MKAVRITLVLACGLWLLGLTPVGQGWQVMVMPALEWTLTPGATPSLTPAEQAMEWVIHVWHQVIGVMQDASWIGGNQAGILIRDGFSLAALLNTAAILCVGLALLLTLRNQTSTSQPSTGAVREIGVGLSQAQFAVTNMLLQPKAQPVAESLRELQQQLQSIAESVQSIHDKR